MAMLDLMRIERATLHTIGVLLDGQRRVLCFTIENPWLNNERNVSCIPEGEYAIRPFESPTFGSTFEIVGVPDRSYILFHAGNRARDTEGCILPGKMVGSLYGDRAVMHSADALNDLKALLRGSSLNTIKVRNA